VAGAALEGLRSHGQGGKREEEEGAELVQEAKHQGMGIRTAQGNRIPLAGSQRDEDSVGKKKLRRTHTSLGNEEGRERERARGQDVPATPRQPLSRGGGKESDDTKTGEGMRDLG